ncbi:MAG: hypothetical protein IJG53_00555, partial [Eggerthellaceae bacterium]|nr:hypothetical protein [Eggerthellaceae bacterium]
MRGRCVFGVGFEVALGNHHRGIRFRGNQQAVGIVYAFRVLGLGGLIFAGLTGHRRIHQVGDRLGHIRAHHVHGDFQTLVGGGELGGRLLEPALGVSDVAVSQGGTHFVGADHGDGDGSGLLLLAGGKPQAGARADCGCAEGGQNGTHAAKTARPGLQASIAEGDFSALFEWLRQNIWQHGSRFSTSQLITQATGE